MDVGMEPNTLGNLPERILRPNDKLTGTQGTNPLAKAGQTGNGFGTSLASEVMKAGEASEPKGLLEGLINGVDAKQKAAAESRRAFLSGESNNLHQTMIAGQESSVAFTMMVEMRNKVMEAYQELMRMQI